MTRKDQEIGFIINLEHILSHHWFIFLVWENSLTFGTSEDEQISKSVRVNYSSIGGNRKQGGVRRFQNHPEGWGSEGQEKPHWLPGNLEARGSQEANSKDVRVAGALLEELPLH